MKLSNFTLCLIFSSLCILTITSKSNASHIMGGDLTYTCTGNNTYELTLKLFRDCNGIALGNAANVNFASPTCGTFATTLTLLTGYPQVITSLCNGEPDLCNTGFGTYGVQEYIYKGSITLTCSDEYTMSWSSCCRNANITTLTGSGNSSFYLSTILDTSLPTCNNSPKFLNSPVAFFCANEPVNYNHGVVDVDNDSLVFSLVDCRQMNGGTTSYVSPYSGTTPLASSTGLTIDATTGSLSFTPNTLQVGVVCVLVEEFRNGVKIGEVIRDMQFTIITCNNDLPIASGINGTASSTGTTGAYAMTVCAGDTVDFSIATYDKNVADLIIMFSQTVSIGWNQAISGATFTDDGAAEPTANFKWIPTNNDIGLNSFTVDVRDDGCAINGVNIYTYTINVLERPDLDFGSPPVTCQPNAATLLNANYTTSTYQSGTFSWTPTTNLSNPSSQVTMATPSSTTTYTASVVYANGCTNQDDVIVEVTNGLTIPSLSNQTICLGDSVLLDVSTSPTSSNLSFSNNTTIPIPDNDATGVFSSINVSGVSPAAMNSSSVEQVCINMSHDFNFGAGDLDIYLVSPNGTIMELSTDNGGSNAAPYTNTCFSPNAATAIMSAPTPYTGTFMPEGNFNTFNGDASNGEWKLWVADDAPGFASKIEDWSIQFKDQDTTIYSWFPNTHLSCNDCATPKASPISTTTYSVIATNEHGCTDTSFATITPQTCQTVSTPQLEWLGTGGVSNANEEGRAVTRDPWGNVYATGYFGGTVDFDPGSGIHNLTSNGSTDIYVAKYTSSGNLIWAFNVGGSNTDFGYDVATDAAGNVYITGGFPSTDADFDPSASTATLSTSSGYDMFIAKYDSSGVYQWANNPSFSSDDYGNGISVDASGNVYMVGEFNFSINLGGGISLTAPGNWGGRDILVAKYNTNGVIQWAFNLGNTSIDVGKDITVNDNGDIYITGYFVDIVDFDPSPSSSAFLTTNGSNLDAFVAKYNSNGDYQWAFNIGDNSSGFGEGIDMDVNENIYVTGAFFGTNVDFNPDPNTTNYLTTNGNQDVFVAKYNSNGVYQNAFNLGGSLPDVGEDISVDSLGNIYVTGYIKSTDADFNPDANAVSTLSSNGEEDIFVAKYDNNGTYQWAFNIGDTLYDYGKGIAADNDGNAYVTGYFSSPVIDFDPDNANVVNGFNNGLSDIFIAKYGASTTNVNCAVSIGNDTTICSNSGTLQLTATHAGGTWSGIGITDPSLGVFDPTISGTGTFPIFYYYNDGICNASDTALITVQHVNTINVVGTWDRCIAVDNLGFTNTIFQIDNHVPSQLYTWDFGDGTTINSFADIQTHTYTTHGVYTVNISTTNGGCTSSYTNQVRYLERSLADMVIVGDSVAVLGDTIYVANNTDTTHIDYYVIDWNDGTMDTVLTADTLSHVYSGLGNYTITLYAVNPCFTHTNSASMQINASACIDDAGQLATSVDGTTIYNTVINYVNYGSTINFIHSGGDASSDGDPATAPGFDIAIYSGSPPTATGPTAADINADAAFSGSVVGTTITGNSIQQNLGAYQTAFNGGYPIHLWFAPITLDDHANQVLTENLGSANECVNVSVSEQINMVFLNQIDTANFVNPAVVNGNMCTGRIRLHGGLPQWDASSYTVNIHLTGNPTVAATISTPPPTHNSLVEFTVPQPGTYDIVVTDNNGASRIFQVDMNGCTLCNDDAGTVTTSLGGTSQSTNLIYLCAGDALIVTHNGDAVLTGDPNTFTTPGLGYVMYTSQPVIAPTNTLASIASDPSIVNISGSSAGFDLVSGTSINGNVNITNDGVTYQSILGGIGGTGQLWFAPITIDDHTNNGFESVGTPNECTNVNISAAFPVVFLNSISVNALTTNMCNGSFAVSGGLPQFDNSNYNISIVLTSDTTITGTVTNATPPDHGGIVNFTVPQPGTYNITVTDALGCTSVSNTHIIQPNMNSCSFPCTGVVNATLNVTSNYNGSPISCSGASDGALGLSIVGGVAPLTIHWSHDFTNNTTSATGLSAGIYVVTVTDANGCSDTPSIVLVDPNSINIDLDSTPILCNGDMTSSVYIAGITGGTTPYTYAWSSGTLGVTPDTIVNIGAGSYTVTVTDANGCMNTKTLVLSEPSPISVSITDVIDTDCDASANGSATLSPTGGTVSFNNYSYTWSHNAFLDDSVATNLASGVYYFTVTDANGCTSPSMMDSIVIDEAKNIALNLNSADVPCNGDATGFAVVTPITIGGTANLPYIYSWSHDNTIVTNTATGLTAGTYIMTVTDALGCHSTDSVFINEPLPIFSHLSTISANCNNSDGQISVDTIIGGIPPYMYSIDGANFVSSSNNFTGLATGGHIVTITDAVGCTGYDTLIINQLNNCCSIEASVTTINTDCNYSTGTATVNVNNTSGSVSYAWSNGSTSNTINNLNQGAYTVTVTDTVCSTVVTGMVGFNSPPVIEWENTIGGDLHDLMNEIIETPDGGYIAVGHTRSGISGEKTTPTYGGMDMFIVKVDKDGNKVWDKTYGGNLDEQAYTIRPTLDGNYLLTGHSYSGANGNKTSGNNGDRDIWIIQIDSNGNKIWDRNYGGNGFDNAFVTEILPDSGYIVAGYSSSSISGDKTASSFGGGDYWLLRLDKYGNVLWDKAYGGSASDVLTEFDIANDGGFIFSGTCQSGISGNKTTPNYGNRDFWIVKTDTLGNIEWQKNYGGSGLDWVTTQEITSDGEYLIGGSSSSPQNTGNKTAAHYGNYDYWLIKLDNNGNKIWDKSFGESNDDQLVEMSVLDNGQYILGGRSSSNSGTIKSDDNLGDLDGWLIKTDSAGTKLWDQTLGGTAYDEIMSLHQVQDGGFILGFTSFSDSSAHKSENSFGIGDFWITKLNLAPLTVNLGNDTTICVGSMITLDATSPYATQYWWDTGDTTSTITLQPTFSVGVAAIVTDGFCTIADTVIINVNTQPIITGLISTNPSNCGVHDGSITITATGDSTEYSIDGGINWLSNGGSFTGLSAGTYHLSVRNTNGSCDSAYVSNPVILTAPTAPNITNVSFTDPTDCGMADGTITITATGGNPPLAYSIDGLSWQSFNVFTNLSGGTYTPKVRNNDGSCEIGSSAIVLQDKIAPVINSVVSADPTSCAINDGTITISATTASAAEYSVNGGLNWQVSNSFIGLNVGTYNVAVRNIDGTCLVFNQNNPIVLTAPSPNTDFYSSDTIACVGQNVTFTSLYPSSGSHFWNFGDGSISTQINPSHTFPTEGTYNVCLTITDMNGCDSTLCRSILIQSPTANFTANTTYNPCTPAAVSFSDNSTNAVAWEWSFGDGGFSTLQNPMHVYTNPGFFDVTLVVTSASGCKDTMSRVDYLWIDGPKGDFSYSPLKGCQPFMVDFTVVTQDAVSATIDYGDGQIAPLSVAGNTLLDTLYFSKTYTISGSYIPQLSISDINGCTRVLSIGDTITVTSPTANFTANTTYSPCPDLTVNFTDASTNAVAWEWYFGDGSFSTAQNPTHTYTTADTFDVTLIVTSLAGCRDTLEKLYYIFVESDVNASLLSTSSVSCFGGSDGSIAVGVSGNYPPYTYTWSHDNTLNGAVATNLVGGTYAVTITNAIGCFDVIDSIQITQPLPFSMSMSATFTSCFGGNDGTAAVSVLGGTPPYNYNWNTTPIQTTPVATGLTAGSHGVTVTDANNCQIIDSIQVISPSAIILTTSSTADACFSSGTATVSATGGAGNYTYAWSTIPVQTTATATNLSTGTYWVTVTDGNNCFDTASVFVANNCCQISVNAGNAATYCLTPDNITLTGYSPSGGIWSGPGIVDGVNGIFNGVVAGGIGTYDLIYTYSPYTGCSASDTLEINIISGIPVEAGANDGVCITNGLYTLSGYSPFGGTWSGIGIIDPVNGIFDPTVAGAGLHTLSYTVGSGTCEKTDTTTIFVGTIPFVEAGYNDTVCIDSQPFALTGYSPTNNVTWSGVGIIDSVTGIFDPQVAGVGTFILTINYTNPITGCSNSDTKVITVNPLPFVFAPPARTECNTTSNITLTDYIPLGGVWSGSGIIDGINGIFNTVAAGGLGYNGGDTTYALTYTYTDGNGCSNSTTTLVTVTFGDTVEAGADDTLCIGANLLTLSGYSPVGNGSWSGTGIIDANLGVFDPQIAGVGIHTLTYTYGIGTCQKTDTKLVLVGALPNIDAGTSKNTCIYNPSFILNGHSPVGGNWFGLGIVDTLTGIFNPQVAGLGTHTLTYRFSNPITGCVGFDTTTITVHDLPVVNAPDTIEICDSPNDYTLSGYAPIGGVWSGLGIIDANNGIFNSVIAGGSGVYELYYHYTNAHGCTNQDTTTMIVSYGDTVVAGLDEAVCIDISLYQLTGFYPLSGGTWSGPGIISANGIFDPQTAGAGTHTITYTYGTGTCQKSDTKIIFVGTPPVVNAGLDESVCINAGSLTLNNYAPIGGVWTGIGITDSINGIFDPQVAGLGTHILTYTFTNNITGCTASDTKIIIVNPEPFVFTIPVQTVCHTSNNIILTDYIPLGGIWSGSGIISSTGVFNTSAAGGLGYNNADTSYTLTYTYTDANGCSSSSTSTMIVTAGDTVEAGANDTVCVTSGLITLSGYSPIGGLWSGTGIVDGNLGLFDPQAAGAGLHTLTYTYGVGSCQKSDTKTILVGLLSGVNAGPNQNVCAGSSPFVLTGFSPLGGTWSGTGITGSSFDPTISGVGTFTITYTYTHPLTGCIGTDTKTITVENAPSVNAGGSVTYCNTSQNITLNNYAPVGGVWSGQGIINATGIFNPQAAGGIGTYELYYQYTNPTGCSGFDTLDVTVIFGDTLISGNDEAICIDGGLLTLSGYSPIGGLWSGNGIVNTSGIFNPLVAGIGTHTLSYTYGIGTCQKVATKTVTVYDLPIVNAGQNETICTNSASIALMATPIGGTWSGIGITDSINGIFNPQLTGLGAYTVTYSYTNPLTGCSNFDTKIIQVVPQPIVTTLDSVEYCLNNNAVQLSGYSPLGGTWSGAGIVDNIAGIFIPNIVGVGCHPLVYTYTDGNGCTAMDTMMACVVLGDTVDAGLGDTVCIDAGAVALQGTPIGGTWTGSGVLAGLDLFNPQVAGVGTHSLVYTYGIGSCQKSDTINMTVLAAPTVNAGSDLMVNIVDAPFSLIGYSPVGGTWTGTGISNGSAGIFNPQFAGLGSHTLTYTYTAANGCTNSDVITIQVDTAVAICPTVNLGGTINICQGDTLILNTGISTAIQQWSTGATTHSISISPTANMTISVAVIHLGRMIYDTVQINVLPSISYTLDTLMCFGENIIINGTTYDQNNLTGIEVLQNGSYYGCDSTVLINLTYVGTMPILVSAPTTMTLSTDANSCDKIVNWAIPVVVDSCGNNLQPIYQSHQPNTLFNVGTTTVTYIFENYGDTVISTFDIIIEDNVFPVFSNCPIAPNDTLRSCDEIVSWIPPTVSDNCGIASFTASHQPNTSFAQGATDVYYIAEDISGNRDTCHFVVWVNVSPQVVIDSFAVTCPGGNDGAAFATIFTGVSPFSYAWNTTPIQHTSTITNLSAGVYELSITEGNGCTSVYTTTIIEPAPIDITTTAVTDTNGTGVGLAFATVTGGTPPYFYKWSNGAIGDTATNLSQGIYIVTVTDAKDCSNTQTVQIDNFVNSANTINASTALKVFPNPTTGFVTIDIELSNTQNVNISLYHVSGKLIEDFGHEYTSRATIQTDMSALPAGVYLVRCIIDDKLITKRLILGKY